MDEESIVIPGLTNSIKYGEETARGNCEYCGTYNSILQLIKVVSDDKFLWSDKQYNMFTQPFWCCHYCKFELCRTKTTFEYCKYMIKEEPINIRTFKAGHIKNTLIRKMKTLEDIFPKEIDGIYILPPNDLPKRFAKKTNIIVSFKDLNLLKYFRYVLDREVCLMHTWTDSATSKFYNRAKFWRIKDSRILLALGRIHFQSEFLAIWVWADTRIVSIEFFCRTPVNMIEATPKKILRVI